MNQSYPNAASGLKLMFWGQILSIVGALVTGLGAGLAVADVMTGGNGGVGVVAILGLLVVIAASVLNILGLYKAGDDDAAYRSALMFAIASLVVSVLSTFLSGIPFVPTLLSIASTVLNFLVVNTVCVTTGNLLHSKGADGLADRGATVAKIYFICAVISVVCTVLGIIPIINILSGLVSAISSIVSLVGYIIYLTFLNGSSNSL
ncbi:MAG: hypothetical protein K2M15_00620 [Oscillospiraceae bacterium]|nr:hypothetical protein [Oscillospiraceae bacterium]MDE7170489.1 hypothetical protein [Oscillospiraceae bacterium]